VKVLENVISSILLSVMIAVTCHSGKAGFVFTHICVSVCLYVYACAATYKILKLVLVTFDL